jgi:NADH dehydrogenase FAD-containing subunit
MTGATMSEQRAAGQPVVAVIGGGYAGILVARALDDVADVVLVEPREAFEHNVAALRALTDPAWLPRVYYRYDHLLDRGRVVRDRAAKVEPGRVTLGSGEQLDADYLVLATGSAYPFPAKNDALTLAAAHDRVRAAHAALAGAGRVLLLGAGAVGIELAGEIATAWPDKEITLLDAAPEILGTRFRPELRAELGAQLAGLGVRVLTGSPLTAPPPTEPGQLGEFTVVTEAGTAVTADLWFRCYGVAPASDYLAGELAGARDAAGFVTVTPDLRVTGQDTVFALGDVAAADHKMAGLAGRQAEVVAANLRALIAGEPATATYQPGPPSIAVPVGPEGGSGQRPDSDELLSAELVAQLKGRDLLVDRFRAMFAGPAA